MYKIKLLLTFFIIVISFKSNTVEAKKNKILFKINDEIITTVDLIQETKYLLTINKDLKNIETEKIFEIAKKTLIRNKIKEIEILKTLGEFKLKEDIITNLLLKQFRKNSINDLNILFNEKKINKKFVSNKIRNELLWNEIILSKYLKKVKIDTEQIKKDIKNKSKEKEYLLKEILFNVIDNENYETKINIIYKLINDKSFSEAALTFSISASSEKGGELGWIKENSLSKKIRKELELIEKGKITEPITIPGGFLILQIKDIRISDIEINMEEAVKKISKKKTQEQLEQYSAIYFNKIKKNYNLNEY